MATTMTSSIVDMSPNEGNSSLFEDQGETDSKIGNDNGSKVRVQVRSTARTRSS